MQHSSATAREPHRSVPGFLDSIIILLVSAALVLFLLWAASETLGINAFQHLPAWLEESYHAVWTSVATGATGIGLAIIKVFRQRTGEAAPHYLLYIMGTTILMLVAIGFLPLLFRGRQVQTNPTPSSPTGIPSPTATPKPFPKTILFQGWVVPLPSNDVRVFVDGRIAKLNLSDGSFEIRIPDTERVNVRVCAGQGRIFNEDLHINATRRRIDTHEPNGPC